MADDKKKISSLPNTGPANATDLFIVNQGAITGKETRSKLRDDVKAHVLASSGQPGGVAVLDSSGKLPASTETDPQWASEKVGYYTKTNLQTSGSANVHSGNITSPPWIKEFDEAMGSVVRNVYSTAGTFVCIGDSIGEGYSATDITKSHFSLFAKKVQPIFSTPLSNVGVTNFSDAARYGLTYSGTYNILASGPVGKAIQLTPGASISFVGGFDFVDFWFKRAPGAGFIDIYRNSVLYRSIDCSGVAGDISTFDNPAPVQTPGNASATYELRCRAATANVTITALFQLLKTSNTEGAVYFQRDAVSGYTTQSVIPYLTDIKKISGPSNVTTKITVFFVELGTNNIYNGVSATTSAVFKQDLETIFAALKDDLHRIVYVFPPKAGGSVTAVLEPYENYYTKAISACRKYGVQFIDLSRYNFSSLQLYTGDNIHPNDKGHAAWSDITYSNIVSPEPVNTLPSLPDVTGATGDNITPNTLVVSGNVNTPASGSGLAMYSTAGNDSTVENYNFQSATFGSLRLQKAGSTFINENGGVLTVGGRLALSTSVNSNWAATVQNNGTTGANGLYVNVGPGALGTLFRVDKNGAAKINVSNDGSVQINNAAIDTTAAMAINGRLKIGNIYIISGSGVPNGVVTAPPGSIYTNEAGGAATTLYVKESGTGNTGWVAK